MPRTFLMLLALAGVMLTLSAAPNPAQAEVAVYPGPAGIPASDQYAVRIVQNGRTRDSFVYRTTAKWRTNTSKDTSWTCFSFAGKVTVEVTRLAGPFKSCRILPTSRNLRPTIRERTATFILDRPARVAVEFDESIAHPMLVFADAPEKDVPKPGDPNVTYFAPGVHEIGPNFPLARGQTIYLAGGAYVKGSLRGENATGATVRGRGVLSGEALGKDDAPQMIATGWATNGAAVEGITIVDAPHYNIQLAGRKNAVRDAKMISWNFSTDGVGIGLNWLVEDCFFKVNDDALKLYHSGMKVRRCVIWQTENGAPFQISWNMPSDNRGFDVRDCDVIRVEHRWNNRNLAVFDAIHGGKGRMGDYLFENIRIENASWRLVYLTIQPNEFAKPGLLGEISGVTFRNITVAGPMKKPSEIFGSPGHKVRDVTFENVSIAGKVLASPADGPIRIDPNTTENVRFVLRPAPTLQP